MLDVHDIYLLRILRQFVFQSGVLKNNKLKCNHFTQSFYIFSIIVNFTKNE